jgi:hypothetical protein
VSRRDCLALLRTQICGVAEKGVKTPSVDIQEEEKQRQMFFAVMCLTQYLIMSLSGKCSAQ